MGFVSNEEYLQRWEDAAPRIVQPTEDEMRFLQQQAVEKVSKPSSDGKVWWESYDEEMTPDLDPALQAAIDEYASRVSDVAPSTESKEELCRQREAADEQVREFRWLSPAEYANEKDRVGHIMHSIVFLGKLQNAGVECWYRPHPQSGKITLIVHRKGLNIEPEVACWVQQGFAPELSVMRFDDHGIPLAEKYRGWRTPLLQLILKGIISERKANEVFGKPATTPAFDRYNRTLQNFRNQGNRLDS